jgi:hypothetical protein
MTVDPSVVKPGILPYRNLGYVDLSEDLQKYYKGRPEFPVAEAFEERDEARLGWDQPTAAGRHCCDRRLGREATGGWDET